MDIIFLSAVDWHQPVKLPVHHVVRELSKKHRVLYVDNWGGARWPRLGDLRRVATRLKNNMNGQKGERLVPSYSGLWFVHPLIIPSLQWPIVLRFNKTWLLRQIHEKVQALGFRDLVVWSRVPTDFGLSIGQSLHGLCLLYQSTEKYSEAPTIPDRFRARFEAADRAWSKSADLVFASANNLAQEKRSINSNTHFFPNGVNAAFFDSCRPLSEDMLSISRPIVGFVGNIGSWVDIELLAYAARAIPSANFVLVGPAQVNTDLLERIPNMHLLGAVSGELLPNYLRAFDVGLIPYRLTSFTHYTFPSKLMEYLAMGIPVVTTDLSEIQPFKDHIMIARSKEDFTEAVRAALMDTNSISEAAERRKLAMKYRWDLLVENMESVILATLECKRKAS